MEQREEVTLHGRRFVLIIEGPDDARRYSAFIREIATGKLLTRNPIRGRSTADARDRALEVIHNLLAIERVQEAIIAVTSELAPGATVDLTEDAQAIRAELSGAWEFDVPLTIPRDELYDPETNLEGLRERIVAHFREHRRRRGSDQ